MIHAQSETINAQWTCTFIEVKHLHQHVIHTASTESKTEMT